MLIPLVITGGCVKPGVVPMPVKEPCAAPLFCFPFPLPLFLDVIYAKETLPVAAPPDCGAKVTVRPTF